MASNRASAIFLVSLLIFAAANPLAHATLINGPLRGVSVTGQLCCTSSGNCPGQGVEGVVVSLNCSIPLIGVVTLGRTNTSTNGAFNITVPTVPGFIFGPVISCVVSVQLPLNATICPVLSTPNGLLVGVVQVIGTLLTSVLGLVQNLTVPLFIKVAL